MVLLYVLGALLAGTVVNAALYALYPAAWWGVVLSLLATALLDLLAFANGGEE